jgi:lipoprotein-anchoring transpeptidase ErfK/SrfK
MPFFLRFVGGYGLHAGYVPDYPASHGCVRLPSVMAERFYHNSQVGTPVIVHE